MKKDLAKFERWYEAHEKELLEDWFTYLRFPSVSGNSKRKKDVLACAGWVESYLEKAGFSVCRLESDGYPIVFGEKFSSKEAPTILLYGHYDVQPAEPLDLWKSDPFEPTIRDGRVYARGAEDNKGQSCATMAAAKAIIELYENLPINLKVFVEGEEEIGSPSFTKVAKKYKEKLKADYLIIVDMGIESFEHPCISLGVRGIASFDMKIQNAEMDLHSGEFGGVVKNPLMILCETLGRVMDEKGRIAIEGFYDDIRPLSDEEKASLSFIKSEAEYREQSGASVFHKEEGYTLNESNVVRPTFEINGLWGGHIEEGSKTVLPAEAFAKITCRLVPNQDPKKIQSAVEAHFKKNLPKGLKVEFDWHGGGFAAWTSPNTKLAQIFKESTEAVLGKECNFDLSGGSIPITHDFAKITGAKEFIMAGTGLAIDRIHSPNESFSLEQFKADFLIVSLALDMLIQQAVRA